MTYSEKNGVKLAFQKSESKKNVGKKKKKLKEKVDRPVFREKGDRRTKTFSAGKRKGRVAVSLDLRGGSGKEKRAIAGVDHRTRGRKKGTERGAG